MKRDRSAVGLALAGLLLQGIAISWTISRYGHAHLRPYSLLNHFISELGSYRTSPGAPVFNAALGLGSLFLFPLSLRLTLRIGRAGRAAVAAALVAVGGAVGVALTPMDFLKPHLACAMAFFAGWFLMTALFTASLHRRHGFREEPFLLAAGAATALASGSFLAMLLAALGFLARSRIAFQSGAEAFLKNPDAFRRPAVWPAAVLEWSVLASVFVWVLAASLYLLRTEEKSG